MTVKRITTEELNKKFESHERIVLLDVRAEEKYNEYHIEGSSVDSINIPKTNIFEAAENNTNEATSAIGSLPKEREIIVTCTTGNSATTCATLLAERGYQVVVLDGGVTAWKEYAES